MFSQRFQDQFYFAIKLISLDSNLIFILSSVEHGHVLEGFGSEMFQHRPDNVCKAVDLFLHVNLLRKTINNQSNMVVKTSFRNVRFIKGRGKNMELTMFILWQTMLKSRSKNMLFYVLKVLIFH